VESWFNDGAALAVSPHDPNTVFTTGNLYFNNAYWLAVSFTTDGGSTWHHDTLDSMARGRAVVFDPVTPDRIYLGADSAYSYRLLLVSTDRGATWQRADTGLVGYVNALAVAPDDPSRLYCGTSSGVFRSTNAGANWTQCASGTTQALCIDPTDSRIIYAGKTTGVFVTTDAGTTWQPFNTGLTNTDVLSLALMPGALFAGTDGASVFLTTPLTAVSDHSPFVTCHSTLAVSPNPCRAGRPALVRLSAGSRQRLDIIDATGRIIFSASPSAPALQLPPLSAGVYTLRRDSEVLRLVVTR
jgi:hypothetical protein